MATMRDTENRYNCCLKIAKEQGIEGFIERVEQAIDNYVMVYEKYWNNPQAYQLQFDAFKYGVNQGYQYIKERLIERNEAKIYNYWQNKEKKGVPIGRIQK